MNLTQFVAALSTKAKLSKKQAKEVLGIVFSSIIDTVKGGKEVRIQGFGTFRASKRAARDGFNPKTKAPIRIQAMNVPSFRAGSDFKKAVRWAK